MELAALARDHPASVQETRDKSSTLLDGLRGELAPDLFAAAEERSRARDLTATVEELLIELGDSGDDVLAMGRNDRGE